ncbi:hypothetical protein J9B20_05470 [Klebsiella pneumoniae]
MTKSTITRERLEQLADNNTICKVSWDERLELARMALAAMDSEPAIADCDPEVYEKGVSVCLVAIPKETAEIICQNITAATGCKVDWHYFGGRVHIKALRESSQPAPVVSSEPVAWTWHYREQWHVTNDERRAEFVAKDGDVAVLPLYRHAQPAPVVPDDVLDALQKVARLRLDLNDFDGDRRGIADCLGDAEEALIEVVNRRAAMLSGGKP